MVVVSEYPDAKELPVRAPQFPESTGTAYLAGADWSMKFASEPQPTAVNPGFQAAVSGEPAVVPRKVLPNPYWPRFPVVRPRGRGVKPARPTGSTD